MKQELPIAIVLLAAGGLFWIWQSKQATSADEQLPEQAINVTINSPTDGPHPIRQDFSVVGANYHESVGNSQTAVENSTPAGQDAGQALLGIPPQYVQSNDEETTRFIRLASRGIHMAPAFLTEIQIRMNWSGETVEFTGDYVQAEQGSGHNRLSLNYPTEDGMLSIMKYCDGRFHYTIVQQPDGQKTIEFFDLNRLRWSRKLSGFASPSNPMSWVSDRGLASSFENLANAFNFGALERTTSNGSSVTRIEGRWKIDELLEMLQASRDQEDSSADYTWENLPSFLPHLVEMEFQLHPVLKQFPKTIQFYRIEDNPNQEKTRRVLASIQFGEPTPVSIQPDEYFKLESNLADTEDVTQQYISQIRNFEFLRQAKKESEASRR